MESIVNHREILEIPAKKRAEVSFAFMLLERPSVEGGGKGGGKGGKRQENVEHTFGFQ